MIRESPKAPMFSGHGEPPLGPSTSQGMSSDLSSPAISVAFSSCPVAATSTQSGSSFFAIRRSSKVSLRSQETRGLTRDLRLKTLSLPHTQERFAALDDSADDRGGGCSALTSAGGIRFRRLFRKSDEETARRLCVAEQQEVLFRDTVIDPGSRLQVSDVDARAVGSDSSGRQTPCGRQERDFCHLDLRRRACFPPHFAAMSEESVARDVGRRVDV